MRSDPEAPLQAGDVPHPVARWEYPAVAGLVLLGLAMRVIYVLHMRANPLHEYPTLDAAYHVDWARAIAAGQPFADLAHRSFFRARSTSGSLLASSGCSATS